MGLKKIGKGLSASSKEEVEGEFKVINSVEDVLGLLETGAENKLVMPGFVDTHTHVSMSYFKGLADDLPLMTWLNEHIWPAEKKHLTPEFVYDAALHGCAEMIKNGITTFNDMYFFCEDVARAAETVGIRAIVSESILDFPVAGYKNSDGDIPGLL